MWSGSEAEKPGCGMNAATVFMQATADGAPCREGKYYEVELAVRQDQIMRALKRKE